MRDATDPVLGRLVADPRTGWLRSEPRSVHFLHEQLFSFVLENDDEDEARRARVRRAVQNALDASPQILTDAERYVVQYCEEILARYPIEQRPEVRVDRPSDVWSYVQFGRDIHVDCREDGDSEDGVYLTVGCNCDWEIEHGMQLVLRDGLAVTMVGPIDGHVTNADAYADPKLVGIVYVPLPPPRRR